MSLFKVDFVACNPKNEESVTPAVEALVDTGAELTSLPAGTNPPRTGNRNSVGVPNIFEGNVTNVRVKAAAAAKEK